MSRTWDDHTRDQIYTSVQPWRDVTRLTEQTTAPFYFSSGWTQAGHSSTNMVILYPAYRNWEGLLMYQLFVRVQRWRPIPLRQLFYPVFVIPRCSAPLAWHTDWHRCLDTRWVGLCSSLSQGKFLCCSRLPQTRVDCVTHVTHWDTIARQVNSSENENLSTLWFVFASLYVIWGNLDRTTRNIYLGSLFCLPTVLYLYLNRGINIVQQSGVYLFIIYRSNVLGTNYCLVGRPLDI